MTFKPGDKVTVRVLDQGKLPPMMNQTKPRRVAEWEGTVVGRSAFGTDWWLVRRRDKGSRILTVPEREMRK